VGYTGGDILSIGFGGRGRQLEPPLAIANFLSLLKLVDNLREGSFVPLSQQPPIRAPLLPIGGLGWTALLELLPGL
jgi:hypothetical protein